jgi:uncharacterized protein YdeI (YjbR/CyaY-like superfamily)
MGTRDPRIDAYIEKSADFARPILARLREVVHDACPDVEETMKWSMPHFMYGGGILCGMASFKQHCSFGFWNGSLIVGDNGKSADAMGQFGRLTTLGDLPSKKILAGYVKQAMQLRDAGVKPPARSKPRAPRPEAEVPDDFAAALGRNRKAKATFDGFSPSHRREYIEWIGEAKSEATRERRLATAIEWLEEGKSRHWKYTRA